MRQRELRELLLCRHLASLAVAARAPDEATKPHCQFQPVAVGEYNTVFMLLPATKNAQSRWLAGFILRKGKS